MQQGRKTLWDSIREFCGVVSPGNSVTTPTASSQAPQQNPILAMVKAGVLSKRLFKALVNRDTAAVNQLLAQGADARSVDDQGTPALCEAAYFGNLDNVVTLVQHGADVNETGPSGYTPIMSAMEFYEEPGVLAICQYLIEQHANVNVQSFRVNPGITALHCAASQGYPEVVKLLLDHGADASLTDENGQTPLMMVHEEQDAAVIEVFHQAGVTR